MNKTPRYTQIYDIPHDGGSQNESLTFGHPPYRRPSPFFCWLRSQRSARRELESSLIPSWAQRPAFCSGLYLYARTMFLWFQESTTIKLGTLKKGYGMSLQVEPDMSSRQNLRKAPAHWILNNDFPQVYVKACSHPLARLHYS